ncbi:hypothetical protein GP486_004213 [Trichoglossum hirsutum]|uniref:Uncharacterized protein n=1 Tax=Trichoglossum hirsutum TaxID=265104 RepID=A0A9P8RQ28_9PEZI|nr:hypothetical protein GP486_004213 [Trichoglossum hirsutum]
MRAKSKTHDPEKGLFRIFRSKGAKTDGSNYPTSSDWESKLDEYTSGSLWLFDGQEYNKTVDLAKIPQPSASTNLFLLEGLSREAVDYFIRPTPGLNKTFFYHHFLDCLPEGEQKATSNSFFFKWRRRALQKRHLWNMETRIAAGKAYDSETLRNPADIGLDHKEFKSHPRIRRPYEPLEPQLKLNENSLPDPKAYSEYVRHAVHECCSFLWTKIDEKFVGVLVFDSPRKYATIQKKYKWGMEQQPEEIARELCFVDDFTARERFTRALDRIDQAVLSREPELVIKRIILQFIRDDYLAVLSNIRDTLEFIDFAMSNDNLLHDCVPGWRVLFGKLRMGFSHSERSISDLMKVIRHHGTLEIEQEPGHALDAEEAFCSLNKEVQAVRTRAESTFQALMSTMSIVESQKAIVQQETVSKLTSLAFFFIPLTLSASVFGMNIVVSSSTMTKRF